MKNVIFDSEIIIDGNAYPILNARSNQGCFIEILRKTYAQMRAMLSHHCKVIVSMMVFHQYKYTATNEKFSKFMRKLVKRLKKKYGFLRIGYLWIREEGEGDAQHYHLALIWDANKVQFPHSIFALCGEIWEGWNEPQPIFTPKKSYYTIRRGDEKAFKEAFKHLSYFAKTRTKGLKPKATNDYYTSQIKPEIG